MAAFDFHGRNALVVGGSGAIGNAIAQALRAHGAAVHVWGSLPARSDYAARSDVDLDGLGYSGVDLGDPSAIASAAAPFERLDVLVLAQGISSWREEFELDGFRKVVEINLNSVMGCCLKFHPQLAAARGCVVMLNSIACVRPTIGIPAYSAAKAGMENLTRSLAEAWASEGIRVNGIAPGYIATRMTEQAMQQPGRLEAYLKKVPLGRAGTVEDVTNIALFLASDMAAYVVGHTIIADGGRLLR